MNNKYLAFLFLVTTLLGLVLNSVGQLLNPTLLTIINYMMLFSFLGFLVVILYYIYQQLFRKKKRYR